MSLDVYTVNTVSLYIVIHDNSRVYSTHESYSVEQNIWL